jgi:hypothetical protein
VLSALNFAIFENIAHLTFRFSRRAGGGGQLRAAARAAVSAAVGLDLPWRYKPGRIGRGGIASEGTAHLLVVQRLKLTG